MAFGAFGFSLAVGLAFTWAFARQRSNADADVSETLWTRWLGVGLPMLVLTALLGATLLLGERQFVRDQSLPVVRATASQWEWRFEPLASDGSSGPASPRLSLATGQAVIVELVSRDVIHSFWVPRLAGKMDVVPGKRNRHLIRADRPGTYVGQCAEYCGVGHARMRFVVEVRGRETDQ